MSLLRRLTAAIAAAVILTAFPAHAHAAPPRTGPADHRDVTLITGDVVTVGAAEPNGFSVRPGPGRSGIGFLTGTTGGRLSVVPSDAVALLNEGRLDTALFDVTGLLENGYDDRAAELPLIVAAPDTTVASTAGTRVGGELRAVRGFPAKPRRAKATAYWNGITAPRAGRGDRALRGGVRKIWLDRQVRTRPVAPAAGAPQPAGAGGFDDSGVPVGIIDTGIDAQHPDLAGLVADARDFTSDQDPDDLNGHGTHVAGTVAGTGAASSGVYRGVARTPLYNAKALNHAGSGPMSGIIAAMEWLAVEKKAKVVNMSLGYDDTPGQDPVETALAELTREHGTLFVVSAGNEGRYTDWTTLGSPGATDEALTVGAVTANGGFADFSSRGPRVGDGALKPDVTAYGVDVVAALATNHSLDKPPLLDGRYVALSGTSMAAPHVAGAAAILAKRHPDWPPAKLKSVLTASARPADRTSFQQGAGMLDLTRAVNQTVLTNPSSVSFPAQKWPHTDDRPVTRKVTYRNTSAAPVTFALKLTTFDPAGRSTPARMFTLDRSTLTVPARGTAAVEVTVDARKARTDGPTGGRLTATAGDVVVQTPIGVQVEPESYDLRIVTLGADGEPPAASVTRLTNLADRTVLPGVLAQSTVFHGGDTGVVTIRAPRGRYILDTHVPVTGPDADHLMMTVPLLDLTKDTTVRMNGARAKPVAVTLPDTAAVGMDGGVAVTQVLKDPLASATERADHPYGSGVTGLPLDRIRTAQFGDGAGVPGYITMVGGQWGSCAAATGTCTLDVRNGTFADVPDVYALAWFVRGAFPTGLRKKLTRRDLAAVRHHMPATQENRLGELRTYGLAADSADAPTAGGARVRYRLPATQTTHVNGDPGTRFGSTFAEGQWNDVFLSEQTKNQGVPRDYPAGRSYDERWNTGIWGPGFVPGFTDLSRTGDTLMITASTLVDGQGRYGSGLGNFGISVDRDGEPLVARDRAALLSTPVPAETGRYRVTITRDRAAPTWTFSTRVETSWTFTSGHLPESTRQELPLSVVRFTPALDPDNAAPAGRTFTVPVEVRKLPGSAAGDVASLTVQASFDDGATWHAVPVRESGGKRHVEVPHPAGPGFVSLKAALTDTEGNTNDVTIMRAYRF